NITTSVYSITGNVGLYLSSLSFLIVTTFFIIIIDLIFLLFSLVFFVYLCFIFVLFIFFFFFFQAEDGIRDKLVTGVQTCALPICRVSIRSPRRRADDHRPTLADGPQFVALSPRLPDVLHRQGELRRSGQTL